MWNYFLYSVSFVVVLYVIFLKFLKPKRLENAYNLPGQHFLFGLLFEAIKNFDRIHDFRLELAAKAIDYALKGDKKGKALHSDELFASGIFPGNMLVEVYSERLVEHVLKGDFDAFEKGEQMYDRFFDLLGNGIFNVDGTMWREQRKVASHMFSAKVLNDKMLQTFSEHAVEMIELFDDFVASGRAESTPVDMQRLFFSYTFDCISNIAFGLNMGAVRNVFEELKSGHKPSDSELKEETKFQLAFDHAQELVNRRFMGPTILWKFRRFFSLGFEPELKRQVQLINQFVCDIVRERKANKEKYQDANDLLSLFITDAAKRGEELSDVYLRDVIMNFMIAGRDTTASALTYFFYNVSCNPDVEKKVVEESADALRGSEPTHDLLKKLVYTECAINESIRLNPPVSRDMKWCVRESKLPTGHVLSPGTLVIYSPHLMNRLKHVWGEDADDYKPERWVVKDENDQEKVMQPSSFRFVTFNAGPRLCLGKTMAMMEAKTLSSMLLQRFHFSTVEGHNPHYKVTVVLQMKHGLPMFVTRRTDH